MRQAKGRRVERPQSHKVLEGEAEKLREKLEGLRQQIKAKRQEKEMSKTQHANAFPPALPKPTTAPNNNREQLFRLALAEAKLDPVLDKLRERGIESPEQLANCADHEIDQWKDIPVGYRIKLKKFIEKHKSKPTLSEDTADSRHKREEEGGQKQEMDIEEIIKQRKAEQVFVPLKKEEEVGENEPELEEDEQEKMMLSILQVISVKQRASSIAKATSKREVKKVHWSASVEEMEKNHKIKIYPKETVSKSLFHLQENEKQQNSVSTGSKPAVSFEKQPPNHQYCWSCLTRISGDPIITAGHLFCSSSCELSYESVVNPVQLLSQMAETEDRYNSMVERGGLEEEIDLIFQ